MPLEIKPWDIVDYLGDDEDMAGFLTAILDEDPTLFQAALGDVARAKSMTQVARATGLGRESLYKSLSNAGNPSFATMYKVLLALGFKLEVAPATVDKKVTA